jgi:hypothetical protein
MKLRTRAVRLLWRLGYDVKNYRFERAEREVMRALAAYKRSAAQRGDRT